MTFYEFLRLRLIDDVIFNFIRNEKVTQKTHGPVDYVINCHHFIREIPDFSLCQGSSQMTPRNLFQENWWSCSKNATTLKSQFKTLVFTIISQFVTAKDKLGPYPRQKVTDRPAIALKSLLKKNFKQKHF